MEAERIENSRYLRICCHPASRWKVHGLYGCIHENVPFISAILKSQGDDRVFNLKVHVFFKGYWRFKNESDLVPRHRNHSSGTTQ